MEGKRGGEVRGKCVQWMEMKMVMKMRIVWMRLEVGGWM
jgi:hypothetical protein